MHIKHAATANQTDAEAAAVAAFSSKEASACCVGSDRNWERSALRVSSLETVATEQPATAIKLGLCLNDPPMLTKLEQLHSTSSHLECYLQPQNCSFQTHLSINEMRSLLKVWAASVIASQT